MRSWLGLKQLALARFLMPQDPPAVAPDLFSKPRFPLILSPPIHTMAPTAPEPNPKRPLLPLSLPDRLVLAHAVHYRPRLSCHFSANVLHLSHLPCLLNFWKLPTCLLQVPAVCNNVCICVFLFLKNFYFFCDALISFICVKPKLFLKKSEWLVLHCVNPAGLVTRKCDA